MGDIKLKIINEQTQQTNKNSQTLTTFGGGQRGGAGRVVKMKESQMHFDGGRFDFGWWAHNAI